MSLEKGNIMLSVTVDGKALNGVYVCVRGAGKRCMIVAIYRVCPFVLPLSHCAIHHTVTMERERAAG